MGDGVDRFGNGIVYTPGQLRIVAEQVDRMPKNKLPEHDSSQMSLEELLKKISKGNFNQSDVIEAFRLQAEKYRLQNNVENHSSKTSMYRSSKIALIDNLNEKLLAILDATNDGFVRELAGDGVDLIKKHKAINDLS